MFPDSLIEIVDFLRKHKNLPMVKEGSDPRANSAASKKPIVTLLLNERRFNIESSNIGKKSSWYDFKVDDSYYVGLKISALRTNDNTNAKKPIYYTLTGLDASKVPNVEKKFFNQLKQDKKPNDCDFYYIIIGKEEKPNTPKRTFLTSLRTLKKVNIAGNNLPFQCNWGECLEPQKRSYEEAADFLLRHWSEGINRKIENVEQGMPKHFPDYFPDRKNF